MGLPRGFTSKFNVLGPPTTTQTPKKVVLVLELPPIHKSGSNINWLSPPKKLNEGPLKNTSWCFQPIWKICSPNWIIIPRDPVKNKKHVWSCHHLDLRYIPKLGQSPPQKKHQHDSNVTNRTFESWPQCPGNHRKRLACCQGPEHVTSMRNNGECTALNPKKCWLGSSASPKRYW